MRKNLSPWCQMIVALSPCLVFYDRNRRGGKKGGGEGLEEGEDMTLEALASNEISNFLVYDTISATPTSHHHLNPYYFPSGNNGSDGCFLGKYASTLVGTSGPAWHEQPPNTSSSSGRKKRRRRPRSCKNKEEAECQRMTHIAVERNRRRQMNEHLAVLRSLMPESYVQRGDQASIVGGAIDFVKELEQLLQSLEAQKRTLQNQHSKIENKGEEDTQSSSPSATKAAVDAGQPPFAQFFSYPQYMWCHASKEYPPDNNSTVSGAYADIEVTLIETHTSLRILSRKRPGQLLKLVAGLQAMELNILHINVVTMESMVLYSISAKVEDGCNLTTVDDIAAAVHHMISLIEAEASAIS